MACGVPVVSSNAGSLPEVIGNVGVMHDPKDVTGFALEIDRILIDADYRNLLIAQGFEQASKFTWQLAASEIAEVYKEIS
jgi:glycosyltransferase involved in cell wall biosynthesis